MDPLGRVEFQPEYTSGFLNTAATSFVQGYLFATYGKALLLACIVNGAGFVLVLLLGGQGAATWFVGAVALLGPVWLAFVYFRYPARFAASAERAGPITQVALSAQQVSVTTRSGSTSFPWSKVKAVVESPSAFLLVLSPSAFLPLPKQGMPPVAASILEQRKSRNVT